NIAAINYHFGSKASLYKATWECAIKCVQEAYPLDRGVSPGSSPNEKLRAFIAAMVGRITDDRPSYFHRIHMMEFFKPSGVLDDLINKHFKANREYTLGLVREFLGPKANESDMQLCELSIISQIRMVRPKLHPKRQHPWHFACKDTERVIDHITRFSLAGIAAIKGEIDARTE
ncbi:MAG: CerR family C-terminal domain-containing protein, partial [Candidatus Coatesbacteria bacterium]|nr:CerR family C-terminal domain-containing protein [Candidatus Coatesbacteria bacterium]